MTSLSPAGRPGAGFLAAASRKPVRPAAIPSRRQPTWPGWRRANGQPSRTVMFLRIRHSSVRWPALWSAATKRSPCWPLSARGPGSSKTHSAAAPDLPGHWRRVLTITYAHLQRKEVSQIKKKEGTGVKRVNINIPTELHNSFKAATAAQGLEMTIVLLEFIENYVAKSGYAAKPKSRRA